MSVLLAPWQAVLEYFGHRILYGHWTYAICVEGGYACYRRECGFKPLRFPSLA